MIGQGKLQQKLKDLIDSGKFPRFSLFVGEQGSGRCTIIHQMLQQLGVCQDCEIDVGMVRDVIDQAYSRVSPTIYVFSNADNMSVAAKNALLKVTEEPPNNAYFVMTLANAENTLPTIRSRATVFFLDTYTPEDILRYYHRNGSGDEEIIKQYCNNPGDVDLLCSYSIKEFKNFIQMVIDNVEKVSGANSFKIGTRLNLGTDESKYDLALFWKAFRAECLNRIEEYPFKYIAGVNVTSKYLYELRVAGINKQMCFDNWLLDLRKEWMEYAGD